jgi:hypothetical protein
MKKHHFVFVLALLLSLSLPLSAIAMSHGDSGHDHGSKKAMDHGKMEGMDHGKMAMEGSMIMLQEEEVDGVSASAHLMDVKEKMAEHGMSQTHHIMISFMDAEGHRIETGSAAVKIESPDEKVGKPIKMMAMDGHFGADITLDQKGTYHFKVGTKLPDGQKRTFHFHYEN